MKKAILTLCIMAATVAVSFAQDTKSIFSYTTLQQAEVVLKAMSVEMHLTGEETGKIKQVLFASVENMNLSMNTKEAKEEGAMDRLYYRQSQHIDANLRSILTADRYEDFVKAIPAIEARIKELSK